MPVTRRILILTDDPELAEKISLVARKKQVSAFFADTAARAIELVKQNIFNTVFYDLSFNDARGLELVSRLAGIAAQTPIVVMAQFGQVATAREALRAGATDYILLPATAQDLRATYRRRPSAA
jgi:two-component system response regulator HydG